MCFLSGPAADTAGFQALESVQPNDIREMMSNTRKQTQRAAAAAVPLNSPPKPRILAAIKTAEKQDSTS